MIDKPFKRRCFIKSAALFSAGLAGSFVFPHRTRASDDYIDAVVIAK
ncbi:hypothetical protein LC607_16475 [Nostoc sp. CHAB 5824]|nr:hypothetical protein [Nostoc sp. CHAB 5824]